MAKPVPKEFTTTMTQNLSIALNSPVGQGLNSYLQAVNAAPILSRAQEQELARRYHSDQDLDAARELIVSQLRSVVRVARGFMGYGLPLADLIQEGNIGLMKAVKTFDPDRGVRLVSFAVHWIRAEIYDFVLRNWRIVKVATTKAQRKLFFNLRKSRTRLGWMNKDEIEALAEKLDVPAKTVQEMESRMAGTDLPFDGGDDADDDKTKFAPANYLQDMRYSPERLFTESDSASARDQSLGQAMEFLDERSRNIVQRRWLAAEKSTLHELAREYGISAERIRQIEKRALEKMRTRLVPEPG